LINMQELYISDPYYILIRFEENESVYKLFIRKCYDPFEKTKNGKSFWNIDTISQEIKVSKIWIDDLYEIYQLQKKRQNLLNKRFIK